MFTCVLLDMLHREKNVQIISLTLSEIHLKEAYLDNSNLIYKEAHGMNSWTSTSLLPLVHSKK